MEDYLKYREKKTVTNSMHKYIDNFRLTSTLLKETMTNIECADLIFHLLTWFSNTARYQEEKYRA